MVAASLFDAALAHHRAGRLAEAEPLYRAFLERHPGHADAMVNLGALHAQRGEMAAAAGYAERAVASAPHCLNGWTNLAAACHALDDPKRCGEALEAAHRLAPQDGSIALALASLWRIAERFEEAEALLRRLRGAAPDHPEVAYQFGLLCLDRGRSPEAAGAFRDALAHAPHHAGARYHLALALERMDGEDEAIEHYSVLLDLHPGHLDAVNNLALLQYRRGETSEAAALLERAIAAAPDNAQYRYNYGTLLNAEERFEEAIEQFDVALDAEPGHADARLHRGNALKELGRYPEAIADYHGALERSPSSATGWANLGLAQHYSHAFVQAEASFRRSLAIEPGNATTHTNLALLLLQQERFAPGWDEYEWRLKVFDCFPHELPLPLWDGQPLRGRGILVLGEQGPGDMIMFAHCLPDLLAQTERVVLTVEPRLESLFARSFPAIEVRAANYRAVPAIPEGCDFAIAIGSLPRFFRPDAAAFRAGAPVALRPQPEALARWRERYAALGPGLKIGISWAGGASPSERLFRVMAIEDWAALFALPETRMVNLQYGPRRADAERLARNCGGELADWPDADPVAKFDDHVAQIAGLDAVVSVANTVVHAAAACGVPTLVLAPANPSWRWGLSRGDCLWYPGMELIRQAAGEPWSAVVGRAAQRLARRRAA